MGVKKVSNVAKIGRPRKYNKNQVKEIQKKLRNYIDTADLPIIAEFAYRNEILRESLYDYPEFSTLIKRAIDKKETVLEKGVLAGKLNPAMGIFSLKQLGWSDRQDIALSGRVNTDTKITFEIVKVDKPSEDEDDEI